MASVSMGAVAAALGASKDDVAKAKRHAELVAEWGRAYSAAPVEVTIDLLDGTYQRKRASLRTGKRGCEDWAGLVWTENASIIVGDEKSAEAAFIAEHLGDDFTPTFSEFLERQIFARGCGAAEILLDGIPVNADGTVTVGTASAMRVAFVPAANLLPLAWSGRRVTRMAVLSFSEGYVDVRIHSAGIVEMRRFKVLDSGTRLVPDALPEGIAESVTLAEPTWLLHILRPGIANNIEDDYPLGISVLANAASEMEAVDVAFDNFIQDFRLGGKMVFIPETMLRKSSQVDSNGNPVYIPPQRDRRDLFVATTSVYGDEGKGIHEHNPDIRVEENTAGIDAALSLLGNALGMGAERYRYRGGTIATATQIVSENSDLFRNRQRHLLEVRSFLVSLVRSMLWVGRNMLGLPLDTDVEVKVRSDDSVIEDDGTRLERGLRIFTAGAISQRRFLIEYCHFSEADADAEVAASAPPPLFGE